MRRPGPNVCLTMARNCASSASVPSMWTSLLLSWIFLGSSVGFGIKAVCGAALRS